MAKQLIMLVLLTTAAIFFNSELSLLLDALVYAYSAITQALKIAFSEGDIGLFIQNALAILVIPILCGLIAAALFRLFKRQTPHTMTIVWVVWLILMVTITLNPIPQPSKALSSHHNTHIAMNYH